MATLKSASKLVTDGNWIESKDQSDCGIRLIQTGNIGIGEYLDKSAKAKFISEETFFRLKCTEVLPGDILISRLPDPIGRACIVPRQSTRAITAVDCTIVRLNNEILDSRFFVNYTQSTKYFKQLQQFLTGTTHTRISRKNLEKIEIPTPALDEQRKIAAVLDKAAGLISLRKQQLAKLDELAKALFLEMFGDPAANPLHWKQAALNDIAVGKLTYGSGASSCAYDGAVRYIRITDIDDNGNLNSDVVSPSVIEEKYLLNEGDILFARSGATVGKTYRYRKAEGKCLYAGYLIRLIPDQRRVLPDYVFYYTKTSYYENFVASNMKVVAQANINAKQYGNLLICVPPLSIQQEFVSIVQQINRQKLIVQQGLDELKVLKKSLTQEYFG